MRDERGRSPASQSTHAERASSVHEARVEHHQPPLRPLHTLRLGGRLHLHHVGLGAGRARRPAGARPSLVGLRARDGRRWVPWAGRGRLWPARGQMRAPWCVANTDTAVSVCVANRGARVSGTAVFAHTGRHTAANTLSKTPLNFSPTRARARIFASVAANTDTCYCVECWRRP